jgi:hypothetical protein
MYCLDNRPDGSNLLGPAYPKYLLPALVRVDKHEVSSVKIGVTGL